MRVALQQDPPKKIAIYNDVDLCLIRISPINILEEIATKQDP